MQHDSMIKYWKPAFSAFAWLGIYLLLVLAPLLVLFSGQLPSGSGFWWDFSMALGFTAMAMMGVQFLLTARFRRATAPFGIDIIYYFHRYFAILAVSLIFLHFLCIQITNPDALGSLNPLQAPVYMSAGRLAFILFVIMIVSSLWRKKLHIHYDQWRILHICLAVSAFLLALSHIEGVGYYINAPGKRALWGAFTIIWVMLIVYIRLLKPWFMYKKPYRVVQLRRERGCSSTLVLEFAACEAEEQRSTSDDSAKNCALRFKPGQFAWLSLRSSPWQIKEHPFSISSSAQSTDRLEFTIKELGDFTRGIKDIQPGELAYIDGPYGIFSIDQYPEAAAYVFIAGGVGVAPIISMLRSLADRNDQRPLIFIYANDHWRDVIFREQLDELKQRLNLQLVHVIKHPPENWQGESGLITQALLSRYLHRNISNSEYFLCGPKPMSDSVQQALHRLNVPLSNIHFELFEMV